MSALVGGTAGYLVSPKIVTAQPTSYTPQARVLYLFTEVIPFNETTFGIPHDAFFPAHLSAYVGDTLEIHYYNLEESEEAHTFTMTAPFEFASNHTAWPNGQYSVVVPANTTYDIPPFIVTTAGIYAYLCLFHQPTMTGYLAVLEP